MATMKAKKGNPFEYNVMYSLLEGAINYTVYRPDTNYKGVDLIADDEITMYFIECKNRNLRWNELKKLLDENMASVKKLAIKLNVSLFPHKYAIVFKPKHFEPMVAYYHYLQGDDENKLHLRVVSFEEYFGVKYQTRPKGHNLTAMLSRTKTTKEI